MAKETTDRIHSAKPVKAILKVEKNRDGKTGKTKFVFRLPSLQDFD
jgi:replicative DNA helicase